MTTGVKTETVTETETFQTIIFGLFLLPDPKLALNHGKGSGIVGYEFVPPIIREKIVRIYLASNKYLPKETSRHFRLIGNWIVKTK